QLRESDYWAARFLGDALEPTTDLADLLLARLVVLLRPAGELQVVEQDHADALALELFGKWRPVERVSAPTERACLGFIDREPGLVVKCERGVLDSRGRLDDSLEVAGH